MPRQKVKADYAWNEKRAAARAEAAAKGERLQSDEAYRIRRRLQTQLKHAESQLQEAKKSKDKEAAKEARKLVKGLKRDIGYTYQDKKTRTYKNLKKVKHGVSDKVFIDALNAAKRGVSLFGLTAQDVSLFWAATKKAWQGGDYKTRYDVIKNYYGTDTLYEAYKKVMSQEDVRMYKKDIEGYKQWKANSEDVSTGDASDIVYDIDDYLDVMGGWDTYSDLYQGLDDSPETDCSVVYF